jgi:hypothetical protein
MRTVILSTDRDGFVSQCCPVCHRRFKVQITDEGDNPTAYCPYCRHQGVGCWWTPAQFAYIAASAPETSRIVADWLRPQWPIENDEEFPRFNFHCCNQAIKYDSAPVIMHCIACGQKWPI